MLNFNYSYSTPNHSSYVESSTRPIKYLILHFTQVPFNTTLAIFTNNPALAQCEVDYFTNTAFDLNQCLQQNVSSHYLINEGDNEIYNLLSDTHIAYHAGKSTWEKDVNINSNSIGIELVNPGFNCLNKFPHERGVTVKGSSLKWCNYCPQQIQQTIALCKHIIALYNISPCHILGHSDIAPGRKIDPGPLFPWEYLAQHGIGLWYDIAESSLTSMPAEPQRLAHKLLTNYGYNTENLNSSMQAFQQHFRANNIDGKVDLECLQILDSLCIRKRYLA